jgi:vacuolar-type H+-ATPase subunit C/Vma6
MNKLDILCEMHAVIATRLLGKGPWLMEREDALKSNERALEMRLKEQVTRDTSKLTSLGKELDFDLLSVFMGRWDYRDIPIILEQRGLITKLDADSIYEQWAKCHDPNGAMKSYVRKSYLRCFRPPKSGH